MHESPCLWLDMLECMHLCLHAYGLTEINNVTMRPGRNTFHIIGMCPEQICLAHSQSSYRRHVTTHIHQIQYSQISPKTNA